MLEERLTNAYPHHTLGNGAVPGAAQYPNIQPGFSGHAPDVKVGAENFYYGNQIDNSRPSTTMYASHQANADGFQGTPSAVQNPSYPPQAQYGAPTNEPQGHTWGGNPYPSLGSPSPSNAVPNQYTTAPVPSAPGQYYARPHESDSAKSPSTETQYQPSPIVRRDSQYQASAPPSGPSSIPEQHTPAGYGQSPGYSVSSIAPALHQQATGPSQSYYYPPQPQPQQANAPSGYPPMNGPSGTYAAETSNQPPYQKAPQPVEENLIDL
jgi:growth factor-regulated tyrosine kinase substrate